jgi:uncharacterized protein (TIGR02611 family)
MLEKLKQTWRDFEEGPPGERFQQRFKRRQQSGRGALSKSLFITAGILIMVAGIFFLPAPGPGALILLIGAGLIAQELLLAARALDWAEVRVRKLAAWSLEAWHHTSLVMKVLLMLSVMALGAAGGFAAYKLLLAK